MHKLKAMKEKLICCVEKQMDNLEMVDTKELGEVIDMIKDLEETMYYCSIVKAMEDNEDPVHYYTEKILNPKEYYRDMDKNIDKMYYVPKEDPIRFYTEMRDEKEGKSPKQRKIYMEAKHNQMDQATQLHELEKYMNELYEDIVEMISDISPEERQFFDRKMSHLMTKINNNV